MVAVATYNCHNLSLTDPDPLGRSWLACLLAWARKEGIDALCLQELNLGRTSSARGPDLEEYELVLPLGRASAGPRHKVAVLVRKGGPLRVRGTRQCPVGAGFSEETRARTFVVQLESPASDVLRHVSLVAVYGHASRDPAACADLVRAVKLLCNGEASHGRSLVVLGDFNEVLDPYRDAVRPAVGPPRPPGPLVTDLAGRGFVDALAQVEQPVRWSHTQHVAGGRPTASRIDYIFLSGCLRGHLASARTEVVGAPLVHSDHVPLLVRLGYRVGAPAEDEAAEFPWRLLLRGAGAYWTGRNRVLLDALLLPPDLDEWAEGAALRGRHRRTGYSTWEGASLGYDPAHPVLDVRRRDIEAWITQHRPGEQARDFLAPLVLSGWDGWSRILERAPPVPCSAAALWAGVEGLASAARQAFGARCAEAQRDRGEAPGRVPGSMGRPMDAALGRICFLLQRLLTFGNVLDRALLREVGRELGMLRRDAREGAESCAALRVSMTGSGASEAEVDAVVGGIGVLGEAWRALSVALGFAGEGPAWITVPADEQVLQALLVTARKHRARVRALAAMYVQALNRRVILGCLGGRRAMLQDPLQLGAFFRRIRHHSPPLLLEAVQMPDGTLNYDPGEVREAVRDALDPFVGRRAADRQRATPFDDPVLGPWLEASRTFHTEDDLNCLSDVGEPVSAADIRAILDSAPTGRAPGPTGLPYELLKRAPERLAEWIAGTASKLWAPGHRRLMLPSELKRAFIRLLPKTDGPYPPLSQIRPITLQEVVMKVIMSGLVRRVQRRLAAHDVMPVQSHGFALHSSLSAGQHLRRQLIFHSRLTDQPLLIADLDAAKAFDSITFANIARSYARLGAPPGVVSFVEDAATGRRVRVITAHGLTDEVEVFRGTGQGGVQGPLDFILSAVKTLLDLMDPEPGHPARHGLPDPLAIDAGPDYAGRPRVFAARLPGTRLSVVVTAFADDTVVVARSLEELGALIGRYVLVQRGNAIQVRAEKVRVVTTSPDMDGARVRVGDLEVPVLGPREPGRRSLGSWHDLDGTTRTAVAVGLESVDKCWREFRLGAPSTLELQVVCTRVLLPRLRYQLLTTAVPHAAMNRMESRVRRLTRGSLRLPLDMAVQWFHADRSTGGLGIPRLSHLVAADRIREAFVLLAPPTLDSRHAVLAAVQPGTAEQQARRQYLSERVFLAERMELLLLDLCHGQFGLGYPANPLSAPNLVLARFPPGSYARALAEDLALASGKLWFRQDLSGEGPRIVIPLPDYLAVHDLRECAQNRPLLRALESCTGPKAGFWDYSRWLGHNGTAIKANLPEDLWPVATRLLAPVPADAALRGSRWRVVARPLMGARYSQALLAGEFAMLIDCIDNSTQSFTVVRLLEHARGRERVRVALYCPAPEGRPGVDFVKLEAGQSLPRMGSWRFGDGSRGARGPVTVASLVPLAMVRRQGRRGWWMTALDRPDFIRAYSSASTYESARSLRRCCPEDEVQRAFVRPGPPGLPEDLAFTDGSLIGDSVGAAVVTSEGVWSAGWVASRAGSAEAERRAMAAAAELVRPGVTIVSDHKATVDLVSRLVREARGLSDPRQLGSHVWAIPGREDVLSTVRLVMRKGLSVRWHKAHQTDGSALSLGNSLADALAKRAARAASPAASDALFRPGQLDAALELEGEVVTGCPRREVESVLRRVAQGEFWTRVCDHQLPPVPDWRAAEGLEKLPLSFAARTLLRRLQTRTLPAMARVWRRRQDLGGSAADRDRRRWARRSRCPLRAEDGSYCPEVEEERHVFGCAANPEAQDAETATRLARALEGLSHPGWMAVALWRARGESLGVPWPTPVRWDLWHDAAEPGGPSRWLVARRAGGVLPLCGEYMAYDEARWRVAADLVGLVESRYACSDASRLCDPGFWSRLFRVDGAGPGLPYHLIGLHVVRAVELTMEEQLGMEHVAPPDALTWRFLDECDRVLVGHGGPSATAPVRDIRVTIGNRPPSGNACRVRMEVRCASWRRCVSVVRGHRSEVLEFGLRASVVTAWVDGGEVGLVAAVSRVLGSVAGFMPLGPQVSSCATLLERMENHGVLLHLGIFHDGVLEMLEDAEQGRPQAGGVSAASRLRSRWSPIMVDLLEWMVRIWKRRNVLREEALAAV